MTAAISSLVTKNIAPHIHGQPANKSGASFLDILGKKFENISTEGLRIESNINEAVMGKGGLEHIVQDFAEFVTQVEAIKNITDAGISAVKQVVNTPI